jgi:hypothetical protein
MLLSRMAAPLPSQVWLAAENFGMAVWEQVPNFPDISVIYPV